MATYKIIRGYRDHPDRKETIETGLTLEEARAHCRDPETTSSKCTSAEGHARTEALGPWFDGYDEEAEEETEHCLHCGAESWLFGPDGVCGNCTTDREC